MALNVRSTNPPGSIISGAVTNPLCNRNLHWETNGKALGHVTFSPGGLNQILGAATRENLSAYSMCRNPCLPITFSPISDTAVPVLYT